MMKANLRNMHLVQAAIISVCSAAFFTLLVPLQTYLANGDLFGFSMESVLLEALPWFIGLMVGLFIILALSELVLGRFLHVVVVALLLCGYLEVGILSIGLPAFNAATWVFTNPFRKMIDTGILGCVIVLFVLAYRWTKNYTHWISLAVLVLAVSALFDVRKASVADAGPLVKGQCPSYDVLMSTRLSPKRNVLVFVLDSTPASVTTKLMTDNPDLCSHFPGFTAYANNLAMHEMTVRGLPGLMTGQYLEKDTTADEYMSSAVGKDSFLCPYVARECPTYFTDVMLPFGYTNRRLGNFTNEGTGLTQSGPVFLRNSNDTPYVTLLDTVKFRLAPYKFKAQILGRAIAVAMRNRKPTKNYADEFFALPTLAAAPLATETNTALVVFHLTGTHGPITKDRTGQLLPAPTHEPAAFYEYSCFLFGHIAKFMDDLRAKGVYDSSLIILCADHGSIELRQGDGTKGHGADECILWVKPIGAAAPFALTSIPTSNCRIADLVKSSLDKNLNADEVSAILRATNRKFRAKFGRAWWSAGRSPYFYEWRYDDAGKVISCENLGVFKAN